MFLWFFLKMIDEFPDSFQNVFQRSLLVFKWPLSLFKWPLVVFKLIFVRVALCLAGFEKLIWQISNDCLPDFVFHMETSMSFVWWVQHESFHEVCFEFVCDTVVFGVFATLFPWCAFTTCSTKFMGIILFLSVYDLNLAGFILFLSVYDLNLAGFIFCCCWFSI